MRSRGIAFLTSLCLVAAVLGGCAAPPATAPGGEQEVRTGRIGRIDPVSIESEQHMGLGMVPGGIAGGVLGRQIGGGSGVAVGITQPANPELRVGELVRLEGTGSSARVLPR